MIVFLDTEFTALLSPELLSIGLVSDEGQEHYVELDLTDRAGKETMSRASDFVRYNGVIDQWGKVPRAKATIWDMGRRTGEWLLRLSSDASQRVEVAFDSSTDYELMEHAIRDSGLWDRVREIVWPVNISSLVATIDCELASEASFRFSSHAGLQRHHALADARALRAAYLAMKSTVIAAARK